MLDSETGGGKGSAVFLIGEERCLVPLSENDSIPAGVPIRYSKLMIATLPSRPEIVIRAIFSSGSSTASRWGRLAIQPSGWSHGSTIEGAARLEMRRHRCDGPVEPFHRADVADRAEEASHHVEAPPKIERRHVGHVEPDAGKPLLRDRDQVHVEVETQRRRTSSGAARGACCRLAGDQVETVAAPGVRSRISARTAAASTG